MNILIVCVAVIVLFVGGLAAFLLPGVPETYTVAADGIATYVAQDPGHTSILSSDGYKVTFPSRGRTIVALYQTPTGKTRYPAFVVLPGGNVPKENEHKNIARDLRELGYATITLDQRGIGETGGPFESVDRQFQSFQNKNEPTTHLMVADALHAVHVLRSYPEVGNIYIAGVSMGGRSALMAAAMDPLIKGVLVVSSAGYGQVEVPAEQQRFFTSINPDSYVPRIHVPLIMIHALNDTVVPYRLAQYTFSLASQPKQFFTAGEGHGYYTDPDFPIIRDALAAWI